MSNLLINRKLCQVAILAGGQGTRLASRSGNLPKPMVPLLGKPVLLHQIDLCKKHGFTEIALLVHFKHEAISSYFGDGSQFGVHINYVLESEPRGTAGALHDALPLMDQRFLVLYGDTYADVNLERIWSAHKTANAAATLLLHPNDHPYDSDLIELDDSNRVVAVHPYPHPENTTFANLVNAALYVFNRNDLEHVTPSAGREDLAKNTFPKMLALGWNLQGYVTPEYIKDMGTPGRLDKVEFDITNGLPERLSTRTFRAAVFLDRDGTLNQEVNHLKSPEQLTLLPGVPEAIHKLNRAGLLAVGVTNQPVLARGDVSWTELKHIHAKLDHLLGKGKSYLDRMYICPHHPDRGYEGEVFELKTECSCRKPKTGMFEKAISELQIDRRQSWMVGDTTSDILAGQRAGLRTILVRTGYAGLDKKYSVTPEFIVPDLTSAVDWILTGHANMVRQLLEPVQEAMALGQRVILIGGPARAGKSSAATVMAEMLKSAGKTAHILPLDGWLTPVEKRQESVGVMQRYDLPLFKSIIQKVIESNERNSVLVPQYERKTRCQTEVKSISIGPTDMIIIEGVPAMLDEELVKLASVRIYVDVDDLERMKRLIQEYQWRGEDEIQISAKLALREKDELPAVRESMKLATHIVSGVNQ